MVVVGSSISTSVFEHDVTLSFSSGKKMATNSEFPRFVWRDELVQELIELYRVRPCLYDSKSKDYHNRDQKKKCYEEMAQNLGSTVDEVMKKLKCIRSQYSREKQKARIRRIRSGGGDDIYISKWLHCDRLSFLDDYLIGKHNGPNAMNGDSILGEDDESETFMVDCVNNVGIPSERTPPQVAVQPPPLPVTNKRKRSDSEEDLLKKVIVCMDRAAKGKPKRNSTHEIFGQYVASELDEIESSELQRWAKQQITAVLYQAQSGQVISSPVRMTPSSLL